MIASRLVRVLLLVMLALSTGCASQSRTRFQPIPWRGSEPGLAEVAKRYQRGCECGTRLSNNCAHYLSNAFIRAGYKELLSSRHVSERCAAGRPVRAQDMLKWFQSKSKRFHNGIPSRGTGLWAVYQEKPNRRHVLLLDSNTGRYYGTDNCVDWPVQWYYQWPKQ